jgi:N6-L-threonylcarbamoyladenine synthase
MIILSIETSCDETALSILKAEGGLESPSFEVLGNILLSQAKLHEQYGGVFPMLAKREHAKNLIPLFKKLLTETGFSNTEQISKEDLKAKSQKLEAILEREPEMLKDFLREIMKLNKPPIDIIAVTQGPGLEPALWVGISFAQALGVLWDIPVMPVNHMEGHIASVLLPQQNQSEITKKVEFPALALLISGGHTELISIKQWGEYSKIGETRDDAVGEAFDKVARILGLPYPGGPEISRLAEKARKEKPIASKTYVLPRPMIHSKDLSFSFSGLKTAVLYMVEKIPTLTEAIKEEIAREFEDAVRDVLISKTKEALIETGAQTFIVAGGVSANKMLRSAFEDLGKELSINTLIPDFSLSTDNALMIAVAGFIKKSLKTEFSQEFKASGNLSL